MKPPYFSICIPQYNRTDFLIEACRSFAAQTFKDFEVCISDDCSNDGKESELLAYLTAAGIRHVWRRNSRTLRYDGNLRNAIALSSGRYLLLMGNDDGLREPTTLADLRDEIERVGGVAVAIPNYYEIPSDRVFNRSSETKVLGSGPDVAAAVFRSYSLISGVVLDGPGARADKLTALDGSEMYQMYLGTKLVAEGGKFLAIEQVSINKDLQIAGQTVDSYRARPRLDPCPIVKRPLPMGRLLEVVATGLRSSVSPAELDRLMFRVALNLYMFTYPFWGIEYRRVQSRRYAAGVLMALNPQDVAGRLGLARRYQAMLWPVYLTTAVSSLLTPVNVFDRLRPFFYRLAKRAQ